MNDNDTDIQSDEDGKVAAATPTNDNQDAENDDESDNDTDEDGEDAGNDDDGEDAGNDNIQDESTSTARLRIPGTVTVRAEASTYQQYQESRPVTSRTRSRPVVRAPARLTVIHTSRQRSTEPQKPDTSFKRVERDSNNRKKNIIQPMTICAGLHMLDTID